MNELIEKLAEQAEINRFAYNQATMMNERVQEFDKEKFAELIVRECLNQCYNRGMDDELYTGQLKAATYIEEHFGINTRT